LAGFVGGGTALCSTTTGGSGTVAAVDWATATWANSPDEKATAATPPSDAAILRYMILNSPEHTLLVRSRNARGVLAKQVL
jgi:hypothetical protein